MRFYIYIGMADLFWFQLLNFAIIADFKKRIFGQ